MIAAYLRGKRSRAVLRRANAALAFHADKNPILFFYADMYMCIPGEDLCYALQIPIVEGGFPCTF